MGSLLRRVVALVALAVGIGVAAGAGPAAAAPASHTAHTAVHSTVQSYPVRASTSDWWF